MKRKECAGEGARAPIYIYGGDVVTPGEVREGCSVTIAEGKIAAVGGAAPEGAERIDAAGRYVLPGLIDVHTHGRLVALDPAGMRERITLDAAETAGNGVTRFLPTFASAPVRDWLAAMEALVPIVSDPPGGAVPLGVHYEGIFLNPAAGGAHPGPLIQAFNRNDPDHRALFERFGQTVKMVTFAPEVAGNEDLIECCNQCGAVMSLGHSAASPEDVARFAEQGVRHMTHLFNGMKPLNHRDPGPAAAGLARPEISVDLICDGHHLHPEIVRLIHAAKPPSMRILITDNVVIQLPGAEAGGEDEPNRLPDGRFAGSRLRLNRAVWNYHRFTGCPLPEAVALASLNPARLLGIDPELGSIAPGKIADVVIAGRQLEIEQVFIAGSKAVSPSAR